MKTIKLSTKAMLILSDVRLPEEENERHKVVNTERYCAYLSVHKPTIRIGRYALRIIDDKGEYGLFWLFGDEDNEAMLDLINNHTEDAMYQSIIRINKELFGLNVTDTINRCNMPSEAGRELTHKFTENFEPVIKLFFSKVLDGSLDVDRFQTLKQ